VTIFKEMVILFMPCSCSRAYLDLVDWIENNVTFPNSLVDRINPAPSAEVRAYVQEHLHSADCVPVTYM
jgi:mannitol-1-phosphate/altronate dehydrogenase